MNSNNLLAVEPETENDAGLQIFFVRPIQNFTSIAAAAGVTTHKDFPK
jgi:hypothetical protein